MNEDLIQGLYDHYSQFDGVDLEDFDTFKSRMSSEPEVRQGFYDHFSKFKGQDLGKDFNEFENLIGTSKDSVMDSVIEETKANRDKLDSDINSIYGEGTIGKVGKFVDENLNVVGKIQSVFDAAFGTESLHANAMNSTEKQKQTLKAKADKELRDNIDSKMINGDGTGRDLLDYTPDEYLSMVKGEKDYSKRGRERADRVQAEIDETLKGITDKDGKVDFKSLAVHAGVKTINPLNKFSESAKMTPDEIIEAESIEGVSDEALLKVKDYLARSQNMRLQENTEKNSLYLSSLNKMQDVYVDNFEKELGSHHMETLKEFEQLKSKADKEGVELTEEQIAPYIESIGKLQNSQAAIKLSELEAKRSEIISDIKQLPVEYKYANVVKLLDDKLQKDFDQNSESGLMTGIMNLKGLVNTILEVPEGLVDGVKVGAATLGNDAAALSIEMDAASSLDGKHRTFSRNQGRAVERVTDIKDGDNEYVAVMSPDGKGVADIFKKDTSIKIDDKTYDRLQESGKLDIDSLAKSSRERVNLASLWEQSTIGMVDMVSMVMGPGAVKGTAKAAGKISTVAKVADKAAKSQRLSKFSKMSEPVTDRLNEFAGAYMTFAGRGAIQGVRDGNLDGTQAAAYGSVQAFSEGLLSASISPLATKAGKALSKAKMNPKSFRRAIERGLTKAKTSPMKMMGDFALGTVKEVSAEVAEELVATRFEPVLNQVFNNVLDAEFTEVDAPTFDEYKETALVTIGSSIIPGAMASGRSYRDTYKGSMREAMSLIHTDKYSGLFQNILQTMEDNGIISPEDRGVIDQFTNDNKTDIDMVNSLNISDGLKQEFIDASNEYTYNVIRNQKFNLEDESDVFNGKDKLEGLRTKALSEHVKNIEKIEKESKEDTKIESTNKVEPETVEPETVEPEAVEPVDEKTEAIRRDKSVVESALGIEVQEDTAEVSDKPKKKIKSKKKKTGNSKYAVKGKRRKPKYFGNTTHFELYAYKDGQVVMTNRSGDHQVKSINRDKDGNVVSVELIRPTSKYRRKGVKSRGSAVKLEGKQAIFFANEIEKVKLDKEVDNSEYEPTDNVKSNKKDEKEAGLGSEVAVKAAKRNAKIAKKKSVEPKPKIEEQVETPKDSDTVEDLADKKAKNDSIAKKYPDTTAEQKAEEANAKIQEKAKSKKDEEQLEDNFNNGEGLPIGDKFKEGRKFTMESPNGEVEYTLEKVVRGKDGKLIYGFSRKGSSQVGLLKVKEGSKSLENMRLKNPAKFSVRGKASTAVENTVKSWVKEIEKETPIRDLVGEIRFAATKPLNILKKVTSNMFPNNNKVYKPKMVGINYLMNKGFAITGSDHLKVGESFGVFHMGGVSFPLIKTNFDNGIGWAVDSKGAASALVNAAAKNGGRAVVYIMGDQSNLSNKGIYKYYFDQVKQLVADSDMDQVLAYYKKTFLSKGIGKDSKVSKDRQKYFKEVIPNITSIDELVEVMDDPETNKVFLGQFVSGVLVSDKVGATSDRGILQKAGVPSLEAILDEVGSGVTKGSSVGDIALTFDVDLDRHAAFDESPSYEEAGLEEFEHPNYKYPIFIKPESLQYFDEHANMAQISPDIQQEALASAKFGRINKGKEFGKGKDKGFKTFGATVANEIRTFSLRRLFGIKEMIQEYTKAGKKKKKKTEGTKVTGTGILRASNPVDALVKILNKAFPNLSVITDAVQYEATLREIKNEGEVKLVTSNSFINSGESKGFVYNNKIYLNPKIISLNTPVHEFGHVWLDIAKNERPDIYEAGLELLKNNDIADVYRKSIMSNPTYIEIVKKFTKSGATQQEVNEYIDNEVLATMIGDRGEAYFIAAKEKDGKFNKKGIDLYSKVLKWINQVYDVMKDVAGIRNFKGDFSNFTLENYLDSVLGELMGGEKISDASTLDTKAASFSVTNDTDSSIDSYSQDVINGSKDFNKFDEKENEGLRLGGDVLVKSSIFASTTNIDIKEDRDTKRKRVNGSIRDWAKRTGNYIDLLDADFGDYLDSGAESDVYRDGKDPLVTKIKVAIDNDMTIQDVLDGIVLHNTHFPETKYVVKGFTDSKDKLAVVIEQEFFEGAEGGVDSATVDAILKDKGFEKDGEDSYINPITGVEVTDAVKNVIKVGDNVIVFDPIVILDDARSDQDYNIAEEVSTPKSVLDTAIERNNGLPMKLDRDGQPSPLYESLLASGLTENEADLIKAKVYSDNFIAWFGDWMSNTVGSTNTSLIRYNNGEPMLAWHNTNADNISKFYDRNEQAELFNKDGSLLKYDYTFFTLHDGEGIMGGDYDYQYFLNIRNPLVLTESRVVEPNSGYEIELPELSQDKRDEILDFFEQVEGLEDYLKEVYDAGLDELLSSSLSDPTDVFDASDRDKIDHILKYSTDSWMIMEYNPFIEEFTNNYDSFFTNEREHLSPALRDKGQVKSVDNRGTFNGDDTNLLFDADGGSETQVFDKATRSFEKDRVINNLDNLMEAGHKFSESAQDLYSRYASTFIDAGVKLSDIKNLFKKHNQKVPSKGSKKANKYSGLSKKQVLKAKLASRKRLKSVLKELGWSDTKVDATLALYDQVARTWARKNGLLMEDWYDKRLRDVQIVYDTDLLRDSDLKQEMDNLHKEIYKTIADGLPKGNLKDEYTAKANNPDTEKYTPARDEKLLRSTPEGEALYQKEGRRIRGAVRWYSDGSSILFLTENVDVSTLAHELAHMFERDLSSKDRKTVLEWVNKQRADQKDVAPKEKWDTFVSEFFARGFESYLAGNKSPSEDVGMVKVFQKFARWMSDILDGVLRYSGYDIKVEAGSEMAKLFNRVMVFKTPEITTEQYRQKEEFYFNTAKEEGTKLNTEAFKEISNFLKANPKLNFKNTNLRSMAVRASESVYTDPQAAYNYMLQKRAEGRARGGSISPLLAHEHLAVSYALIKVDREIALLSNVIENSKNEALRKDSIEQMEKMRDIHSEISSALIDSGSELAQGLGVRGHNFVMDPVAREISFMRQKAKSNNVKFNKKDEELVKAKYEAIRKEVRDLEEQMRGEGVEYANAQFEIADKVVEDLLKKSQSLVSFEVARDDLMRAFGVDIGDSLNFDTNADQRKAIREFFKATYAEGKVNDLRSFVDYVKKLSKEEITENDIVDALIVLDPKIQDEAAKKLAEKKANVKREAQLIRQVQDLINGTFGSKSLTKRKATSAEKEMKALISEIIRLNNEDRDLSADDFGLAVQSLQKVSDRFGNRFQELFSGDMTDVEKKEVVEMMMANYDNYIRAKFGPKKSKADKTTAERITDLDKRLDKKIAEIEDKIKNVKDGDFEEASVSPELPLDLIEPKLYDKRKKISKLQKEFRMWQEANYGNRFYRALKNISTLPRLLVLGGDMSFVIYQGGMATINLLANMQFSLVGKTLFNSMATMIPTKGAEERFKGIELEMSKDPYFQEAIAMNLKVDLTNSKDGVPDELMYGDYITQWANKRGAVGVIGKTLDAFSGLSERGYNSYLNTIRFEAYKNLRKSLGASPSPLQLQRIAEMANTWTGAASFGEGVEGFLNNEKVRHVFTAPRLYASTFKSLWGVARGVLESPANLLINSDKMSEQERAFEKIKFQQNLKILIGYSLIHYLIAKADSEDDEEDYENLLKVRTDEGKRKGVRNSTFLRARFGKTVVNFNPLSSYIKLLGDIFTSYQSDRAYDGDPVGSAMKWTGYKLTPAVRTMATIISDKDVFGKDFGDGNFASLLLEPSNDANGARLWALAKGLGLPITVSTFAESTYKEGLNKGLKDSGFNFIGMNTYEEK